MTSIAGNKRHHNIGREIAALMEELPKRCIKKIQCPKNPTSTPEKNRGKIITAFKRNGGTIRQLIKEGTYGKVS